MAIRSAEPELTGLHEQQAEITRRMAALEQMLSGLAQLFGARLTLLFTIAGKAICPVTLPEEFSRLWVAALTHCLEILGGNLSFQTRQFSAASAPPAFDRPILVVVVALLEMALCVAFTTGHGSNRQHGSTLALFEIWGQATSWRGC